ncbi:hypothetical protein BDD12DRAFT_982692 [Trichophaea hybrida]|nr:hypothetical protein BDD12DRAFT_982692 [Trichophaea hybrida]
MPTLGSKLLSHLPGPLQEYFRVSDLASKYFPVPGESITLVTLPHSVLNAIVSHLSVPDLGTLRLVHPRFAEIGMKVFFREFEAKDERRTRRYLRILKTSPGLAGLTESASFLFMGGPGAHATPTPEQLAVDRKIWFQEAKVKKWGGIIPHLCSPEDWSGMYNVVGIIFLLRKFKNLKTLKIDMDENFIPPPDPENSGVMFWSLRITDYPLKLQNLKNLIWGKNSPAGFVVAYTTPLLVAAPNLENFIIYNAYGGNTIFSAFFEDNLRTITITTKLPNLKSAEFRDAAVLDTYINWLLGIAQNLETFRYEAAPHPLGLDTRKHRFNPERMGVALLRARASLKEISVSCIKVFKHHGVSHTLRGFDGGLLCSFIEFPCLKKLSVDLLLLIKVEESTPVETEERLVDLLPDGLTHLEVKLYSKQKMFYPKALFYHVKTVVDQKTGRMAELQEIKIEAECEGIFEGDAKVVREWVDGCVFLCQRMGVRCKVRMALKVVSKDSGGLTHEAAVWGGWGWGRGGG